MPVPDAMVTASEAAGPTQTPAVEVRDIVRRFGSTVAVAGVSLDIPDGSFVSILGPSGCGKTTLLRIIAGLERQDAGTVAIAGVDVSRVAAHRRPVNLVFQRYALFPHKTVAENVAFAMQLKRTPTAVVKRRVEEMLALVRLPDHGARTIEQLSGGQAQRVALARALVTEPSVLLLDEPLTALDLKLRQAMQIELREIQRRVGSTFVYVTHDQTEAMVMSDTVVLMNDGHVVQQGAPRQVYDHPTALFSATFLGEANVLRATVGQPRSTVTCGEIVFELEQPVPGGVTKGWVCLRPEHVEIAPLGDPPAARAGTQGRVTAATFIGPTVRYTVATGDHVFHVEAPARREAGALFPEDEVSLSWSRGAPVFVRDDGAAVSPK